MIEVRDAGDRLFLAFLQAPDFATLQLALKGTAVRSMQDPAAEELERLVSRRSFSGLDVLAELQRLAPYRSEALESVCLVRSLLNEPSTVSPGDLVRIAAYLRTQRPAGHSDLALVRYVESREYVDRRDYALAQDLLDETLGWMIDRRDPRSDHVRHLIYLRKARIAQHMGDFHSAHSLLDRALGICARWRFALPQLFCKQRLAHLLWLSGQPEEALAMHLDPEAREVARKAGLSARLARSHLNAAKCAIDCKRTELAIRELDAAEPLLAQLGRAGDLNGYLILYRGQTALQRADIDGAVQMYNEALAYFESLDPPFHPGVLEAKIALAEFALYERKYRLFLDLLKALLAEADEKGCVEARSRLLLLEAYVHVADDSSLKEAFQRSVERVHLINNPALLLKALSYLYHYALERLEDREQAFLLSRIKGLETSLEQSCYEGLYRTYVSSRYQSSIENRLARLLEKEEGTLGEAT